MPLFTQGSTPMTTRSLSGSAYGYSGARVDALGAAETTLVAITADQSGSVAAFQGPIEDCLAEIVRACRSSPRADHVVLRTVAFDDRVHEVHGFKPITACDPASYRGALAPGGSTALFDAAHHTVGAVVAYGEELAKRSIDVNAVVFVVTDGCDCASVLVPGHVRQAVDAAIRSEALQGVLTVLVGVNVRDPAVGTALMRFSTEAGFDHYVELERADAASLARLARFASRSISLASTALGAGAPIKSLTF